MQLGPGYHELRPSFSFCFHRGRSTASSGVSFNRLPCTSLAPTIKLRKRRMSSTGIDGTQPNHSSRIHSMLVQMRVDIASCFIEDKEDAPVYFRNRELLENWITIRRLTKRTDRKKTMEISGWVQTKSGYCWSHQLWVRRDNVNHRKEFLDLVASKYHVSNSDMKKINVDHVVNRKSVQCPYAWILLFPVPAAANQIYGSVVERRLPKISEDVDRGDMTTVMCFKLFCGRIPNSRKDLKRVMRDIRGQIDDAALCDQMKADFGPYIMKRPRFSNVPEDDSDTMPLPPFEGHMVRWIGRKADSVSS